MKNDLDEWPLIRVYHRADIQVRHVKDLMFLEARINYTWLHWSDGWRVLLPRTIKYLMKKLPPAYFLRLHRHFVVNRLFVDQPQTLSDTSNVYLTRGGIYLPVSRRRRSQIRHQLSEGIATAPIKMGAHLPRVGVKVV
jgi:DNA-binding LytR/AlgR family response regulator